MEELDVRLVSGEQARVWRRTTSDVEAYELYLKGSDLNAGLDYQLGSANFMSR
jgi:hypothetical protein